MNLFGWFFYFYEKRSFLIVQVSTIHCHAAVFTEVCRNGSSFDFPSGTFPKNFWEVVIPFPSGFVPPYSHASWINAQETNPRMTRIAIRNTRPFLYLAL
jgi:hypothetical protein